MTTSEESRTAAPLLYGLRMQGRVIGALTLRELHTRFGRRNIGYLWLVVEPLILSLGVASIHFLTHTEVAFGFEPSIFYATGYITFIMFRNNVNRAASAIEGNKPLMYHRQVTLFDIVAARTFLDAIAVTCAMIVVLGLFVAIGLSPIPERPQYIAFALLLMAWYSWGLSMFICGLSEFSPLVERFVHPITYLMIPFSGMFYVVDALPPTYANIAKWVPVPHITDLARMGLRADFNSKYADVTYVCLNSAVAMLLGIFLLRVARRRMHFE